MSIQPIKYSKCMKEAVYGDELENFEKTKHENFHASFHFTVTLFIIVWGQCEVKNFCCIYK